MRKAFTYGLAAARMVLGISSLTANQTLPHSDGHESVDVEGRDLQQFVDALESGNHVLMRFVTNNGDRQEGWADVKGLAEALARLNKDCGIASQIPQLKRITPLALQSKN